MGAGSAGGAARGAMGVIVDEPTYPVIARAPSTLQVVTNFDGYDYGRMGLWTGLAVPFGFAIGGPVKRPSAFAAASLGLLGAFMYGYQQSSGRLMGFAKS